MGLLRFFEMPTAIRRQVIRHYLNKVTGRKSSSEIMGAKNLYKLFRRIRGLQVAVGDEEYKLSLAGEKRNIVCYTRKYPSSDLITLYEVWGKQEYKIAIEMLSEQNIQQPLILDVGANVGYSTLYFKNYFPTSDVICIEPDRLNLNQISKNISANNFENIILLEGALWPKRSKMALKSDYREGTSASFYVVESEAGNVEGYGIKDVLSIKNWNHIDLLKMDIEGAEKYLFEDEKIAASILRITRVIAIEIHDEKADRQKIYTALSSNGFTFFTKGDTTFGTNEHFQ
ncbi:MAG: FkbM family methyltransferase [Bacteroidota bacterium]